MKRQIEGEKRAVGVSGGTEGLVRMGGGSCHCGLGEDDKVESKIRHPLL